nr:MAG TPA: hypothetical protein [Caudoviricetes sp.]
MRVLDISIYSVSRYLQGTFNTSVNSVNALSPCSINTIAYV